MKKQSLMLCFLCLLVINAQAASSMIDILTKGSDLLTPKLEKKDIIIIGEEAKAKKQLESLREKKSELDKTTQEFLTSTNDRIAQTISNIKIVNEQQEKDLENTDFLNKKRESLNETYRTLKEIQSTREELALQIDEHIKILEDYLSDTKLSEYIKDYQNLNRFYSFKDLQTLNQMIFTKEKNISSLNNQFKSSQAELLNRERTSENTADAYEKKKKDLENFIKNPEKVTVSEMFILNNEQKLELLTLQENLLKIRKELDKHRNMEVSQKIASTDTKIFIAELQLNILKKTIERIKSNIIIRETEIKTKQTRLKQKRTESIAIKEKYSKTIAKLSQEHATKNKQLELLSKQINIPLTPQISPWNIIPKTIDEYINYSKIGSANEYLLLLNAQKELLETQMINEDELLANKEADIDVTSTFFKIISRKFITQEEITNEIKKYEALQTVTNATISRYNEKRSATVDKLNTKKQTLEQLKSLIDKLQSQKIKLFKSNMQRFNNCITWLKNSLDMVTNQISYMQETINLYENILETNNKKEKLLLFILSELEPLGKWHRPAYAIKWNEIKNIIPDIKRFVSDLYTYLSQFSIHSLIEKTTTHFPRKLDFVVVFAKLLLLALFLLLFRMYAPLLSSQAMYTTNLERSKSLKLLVLFLLRFVMQHLRSISIWIFLFALFKFDLVPDPYIFSIFLLLSIPYLLCLANRLLTNFFIFNEKHNNIFISKSFYTRFFLVSSILLYSTIIIQLFRVAFFSGIYYKSELSAILLALNFIIAQISLIFLIAKEQILNIIPTKSKSWRWIHQQASKLYYVILALIITIIVLSNPYVGFSYLVWDVLYRFLLTIPLAVALFMLQSLIKKISLKIFFSEEAEIVKERFTYGKTFYGISIIISFMLISIIGLVMISQIWEWEKITFTSIIKWLREYQLFGEKGKEVVLVSIYEKSSVLGFLLIVLLGFILAFAINRFVLKKIFELIPVDTGVQYAVTAILKYLIIAGAACIGIYYIQLGELIKYIIVTFVLSIGFILKDPLVDFLYYFLILIQRPLKIGDYIYLDNKIEGVVRKVTPKSTILRKRNSETILVPNSQILTKTTFNWNYSTGFVAFDDFTITIDYKEDPIQVKNILSRVLDNHPNILKSPKPVIRLEEFGEYGFKFLIRGYISTHYTLDMWDIASDTRFAIVEALKKHNITIAVPVRVIIGKQVETRSNNN